MSRALRRNPRQMLRSWYMLFFQIRRLPEWAFRRHNYEALINALRNGGDNFHAKVTHINVAGPLVKVDLMTDWGAPVHVEISHGKYLSLKLKREDEVFVRPRERSVFVEPQRGIDESRN